MGQDKSSLTEQQTEGNRNNNDTDKEKTQQKLTRSLGLHRRRTLPSRESIPPPRHPPLEPSVTSHGMEYRALFGQVESAPPPGCAPSWSPVKINPVLAKPRTRINQEMVIYVSSI